MNQFLGFQTSPWSEKARWALDHHRVPYRYVEHVPMLGEALLRWRAGRWSGRVSVPLLVEDGAITPDSFAIARRAEALGNGAPLFPAGADDDVARWNERSEEALAAARALMLRGLATRRDVQRDSLPSWVPGPLRGLLAPSAGLAARFIARKYASRARGDDDWREALRGALAAVREALGPGGGGRRHLVGGALSYADITMAVVLHGVSPVADDHIRMGAALRDCWSQPELAAEFADVVAWRDDLYARHRRPGPDERRGEGGR